MLRRQEPALLKAFVKDTSLPGGPLLRGSIHYPVPNKRLFNPPTQCAADEPYEGRFGYKDMAAVLMTQCFNDSTKVYDGHVSHVCGPTNWEWTKERTFLNTVWLLQHICGARHTSRWKILLQHVIDNVSCDAIVT